MATATHAVPGVRAQVRYIRSSAYKAREVLDLIRGERVARALEILEFSERDIARIQHHSGDQIESLLRAGCHYDLGPVRTFYASRTKVGDYSFDKRALAPGGSVLKRKPPAVAYDPRGDFSEILDGECFEAGCARCKRDHFAVA